MLRLPNWFYVLLIAVEGIALYIILNHYQYGEEFDRELITFVVDTAKSFLPAVSVVSSIIVLIFATLRKA